MPLSQCTKLKRKMTTTNKLLTDRPTWKSLAEHSKEIEGLHLRDLFAQNGSRAERFTAEGAGLYLDYSKNRITETTLDLLLHLTRRCLRPGEMYERFGRWDCMGGVEAPPR